MGQQALYKPSLALLTDLYQLTMAYGYWREGRHEQKATFNLFFRKHPFKGSMTVACGLNQAIEYLQNFHFDDEDLVYLAQLTGNDGKPLFDKEFLSALKHLKPSWDVDGVPEGTLVFPHEPLLRVTGPVWQCQLLETALLNILNFQSLIATKALRIVQASGGGVLEFGLRRAQGIDGALSASYAAYVGGCSGTSNVLAGRLFGIPVKGTHAHSWIMLYDDEPAAFAAYARALPNNCVFLVDTYDTLTGVGHAIQAGLALREQGHRMVGIRLDSGDLGALSKQARKQLDAAGFEDAVIVASNDLDEHAIAKLKADNAPIALWGVGTKLVTGYDQPALGGVYKLAAVANEVGEWQPRLKLSEELIKTSNPGPQQVWRYAQNGNFVGDIICEDPLAADPRNLIELTPPFKQHPLPMESIGSPLLTPVFRAGQRVCEAEPIEAVRNRVQDQFKSFPYASWQGVGNYPVGLSPHLHQLKQSLVKSKQTA